MVRLLTKSQLTGAAVARSSGGREMTMSHSSTAKKRGNPFPPFIPPFLEKKKKEKGTRGRERKELIS
jgi:hypothetical protein